MYSKMDSGCQQFLSRCDYFINYVSITYSHFSRKNNWHNFITVYYIGTWNKFTLPYIIAFLTFFYLFNYKPMGEKL